DLGGLVAGVLVRAIARRDLDVERDHARHGGRGRGDGRGPRGRRNRGAPATAGGRLGHHRAAGVRWRGLGPAGIRGAQYLLAVGVLAVRRGIAGVAELVAVGVHLVGVGDLRAVVVLVADAVGVGVGAAVSAVGRGIVGALIGVGAVVAHAVVVAIARLP